MTSAYQSPNPSYNVVEFLLDDAGREAFELFDGVNEWGAYAYPATPNIDSIATYGVAFNHCWAHPVCSPDRAATQTGRYPIITDEHPDGSGIGWVVNLGGTSKLSAAMKPLGIAHQERGTAYSYYHIGKWHLGYGQDDPTSPLLDAGVTEYRGCLTNPNKHQSDDPALDYTGDYRDWTLTISTADATNQGLHTPGHITGRERSDAVALLPSDDSESFVMRYWFHFAHSPFDLVEDFLLDLATATMDESEQEDGATSNPFNNHNVVWRRTKAMIEAMDAAIGLVLDAMSAAQKANTILIVRADNGTDQLALDPLTTSPAEPPAVYNPDHAKQTVYEQGINVPLIIGCHSDTTEPEWIAASMRGQSSNAICSTVDIFQTIAEATLSTAAQYRTDGVSLFPVLRGDATQVRSHAFCFGFQPNAARWDEVTAGTGMAAVRNVAGYKLIRRDNADDELYDLPNDAHEEDDLYPTMNDGGNEADLAAHTELSAQLDLLGVTAP